MKITPAVIPKRLTTGSKSQTQFYGLFFDAVANQQYCSGSDDDHALPLVGLLEPRHPCGCRPIIGPDSLCSQGNLTEKNCSRRMLICRGAALTLGHFYHILMNLSLPFVCHFTPSIHLVMPGSSWKLQPDKVMKGAACGRAVLAWAMGTLCKTPLQSYSCAGTRTVLQTSNPGLRRPSTSKHDKF